MTTHPFRFAAAALLFSGALCAAEAPAPWGAVPSPAQLYYCKHPVAAIVHYGPNTYAGREWGDRGDYTVASMQLPATFDTDQWAAAARSATMERLIMVAKHHDGFRLWKTDEFSVAQMDAEHNPKNIDPVAAVSASCKAAGLDMGLYVSPWDVYEDIGRAKQGLGPGAYGSHTEKFPDDDYNVLYRRHLKELSAKQYGRDGAYTEYWMDGAKGKTKPQSYDYGGWIRVMKDASGRGTERECINQQGGEFQEVGWPGNERCEISPDIWSKANLKDGDFSALPYQSKTGTDWIVWEGVCAQRPHWFFMAGERSKTPEDLFNRYLSSVGRGGTMLLGLAPNRDGVLDRGDTEALAAFGAYLRGIFGSDADGRLTDANNLLLRDGVRTESTLPLRGGDARFSAANLTDGCTDGYDTYWTGEDTDRTGTVTVHLGGFRTFDLLRIQEYIPLGQRIDSFSAEVHTATGWQPFASGTVIGFQRLLRGPLVSADRLRITVGSSDAVPVLNGLGLYRLPEALSQRDRRVPLGQKVLNLTLENTTGEGRIFFSRPTEAQRDMLGGDILGIDGGEGNYAEFGFTGSKFWLRAQKEPDPQWTADALVSVDGGEPVTVDLHTAGSDDPRHAYPGDYRGMIVYTSPDLTNGEHTVRIASAHAANRVYVDALLYSDAPAGLFEFADTLPVRVDEGESFEVTVRRLGDSTREASVQVLPMPGTAVAGEDFDQQIHTLTFAPGETEKKVRISTFENDKQEKHQVFTLELVSEDGRTPHSFNMTKTVEITDNDAGEPVGLTADAPFVVTARMGVGSVTSLRKMLAKSGHYLPDGGFLGIEFYEGRFEQFTADAPLTLGSLTLSSHTGCAAKPAGVLKAGGGRLKADLLTVKTDTVAEPGVLNCAAAAIADGSTLTLRENFADAIGAMAADTGVLRFEGGTPDAPLFYRNDGTNLANQQIVIAKNSELRLDTVGNFSQRIRGEDPLTSGWQTLYAAGGYGLDGIHGAASHVAGLRWVPLAAPGKEGNWLVSEYLGEDVLMDTSKAPTYLQIPNGTYPLAGMIGGFTLRANNGVTLELTSLPDTVCRYGGRLGFGGNTYHAENELRAMTVRLTGSGTQIFAGEAAEGVILDVGSGKDTPAAVILSPESAPFRGSISVAPGATLSGSGTVAGTLSLQKASVLDIRSGALTLLGGPVSVAPGTVLTVPEGNFDLPVLSGPGAADVPPEVFALPGGTEIYRTASGSLRVRTADAPKPPPTDSNGYVRIDTCASWSEVEAMMAENNWLLSDDASLLISLTAERPAFVFDRPAACSRLHVSCAENVTGTLRSAPGIRADIARTRITGQVTAEAGAAHLGLLTVDGGSTLTLRENFADAASAMADNTGVLRFEGGTPDAPLFYRNDGTNLANQQIVIAKNSELRLDTVGNFSQRIRGEDPLTSGWQTLYAAGGYGLDGIHGAASHVAGLRWVPLAAPGKEGNWLVSEYLGEGVLMDTSKAPTYLQIPNGTYPLAGIIGGFTLRANSGVTLELASLPDTVCRYGGRLGFGGNTYHAENELGAMTVRLTGSGTQIFAGEAAAGVTLDVGSGKDTPTAVILSPESAPFKGTVTVNAGATLRGSGTVAGALTVTDGAVIDLTDGALTVTGSLTLDGALRIKMPPAEAEAVLFRGDSLQKVPLEFVTVPEGLELFRAEGGIYVRSLTAPKPVLPGEDGWVHVNAETYPSVSALQQALAERNENVSARTPLCIDFTDTGSAFAVDADLTVGRLKCSGAAGMLTAAGGTLKAAESTVETAVTVEKDAVFFGVLTLNDTAVLTLRQSLNGRLIERLGTVDGTLRFEGGTPEAPLEYDTRNVPYKVSGQKILVAADSCVRGRIDENALHNVTGENRRTSRLEILSDREAGFSDGSAFRNVTLTLTGALVWMQGTADYAGAVLHLGENGIGAPFMYDSRDIAGLTGSGAFRHHSSTAQNAALTVRLDNAGEAPWVCGGTFGLGGTNINIAKPQPVTYCIVGRGTQIFTGTNRAAAGGAVLIGDGSETDAPTVELTETAVIEQAPVTVAPGATLRGAGTLGGNLTLNEGAVLDLTQGALTVNGTFAAAAPYRIVLPEGAAEAVFLKGRAAETADPDALAFDGCTFAHNDRAELVVRREASLPELPKPNGRPDDTTAFTEEAARQMLALTGGHTPDAIVAADAAGRLLTAAETSDALAVFDGIASVSEADGKTTVTVRYGFRVTDIAVADGKVTLTVGIADGRGAPAGLRPGAVLRLYENGRLLGDVLPSPLKNGRAAFTVPLRPGEAPLYKAEACRPAAQTP